jgi:cephalosporin hydroxylase
LNLGAAIAPSFLSNGPRPLLVVDDGAHTYDACLAVLRFFHPHLRPGEYVVVEDGIVADLPPHPNFQYGRGPNGAISDFIAETMGQYMIDGEYCDFFGHNFTWNTNGYLKRL